MPAYRMDELCFMWKQKLVMYQGSNDAFWKDLIWKKAGKRKSGVAPDLINRYFTQLPCGIGVGYLFLPG